MSDVGRVFESVEYGDFGEPDAIVRRRCIGHYAGPDGWHRVWETVSRDEQELPHGLPVGRWLDDAAVSRESGNSE